MPRFDPDFGEPPVIGRILLLLGFFLLIGCGGEDPLKTTVRGTVTYKGQPIDSGTVLFNPDGQELPPSRSKINQDGSYELKVAPGEYRVLVRQFSEPENGDLIPGAPGYITPDSLLPPEYSSLGRTPLKFTIADEEETTIELELE